MRLIDADKAEKQFEVQYCESCNSYNGVKCRACEARDGADVYADMPTIDPVKHGHWIIKKPTYTERYICSECFATGKYHVWSDVDGLNYCPHCGARMDEVRG